MSTYIITVDIGATNTRIALLGDAHDVEYKESHPTPNEQSSVYMTQSFTQIVQQFREVHADKNIVGIGVSVAGPTNQKKGSFHPPTLKAEEISITKPFSAATNLPTFLINDTKAAVLAVHKNEHPKTQHLAYITMSTGIGVGLIHDGVLFCGRETSVGEPGELGHTTVVSPFTHDMHSWEHYTSGKKDIRKGILRFYQKWAVANNKNVNPDYTEPKHLFIAHSEKKYDIDGFMDEVGKINAQGVANVIFAYDPEMIVFGGSIAYYNYDIIIKGIRKYIRRDIILPLPKFARTSLGDNVSLYGAGYYAFEQL